MFRLGQQIGILAVMTLIAARQSVQAAENTLAPANPYVSIIDRNIFNLVDMPTNSPADVKAPEPPLKIIPNGIMTIFGQLQVIFKVSTPTKPGAPTQDHSYVMSVGERQDDIEVTKIDKDARLITFNNHGIIQELTLMNASNPIPAVATSGPGQNLNSRPNMPVPNGAPQPPRPFSPHSFGSGSDPRQTSGNNPSPAYGGNSAASQQIYNPGATESVQFGQTGGVTPEEAVALRYLQAKAQNSPLAPLYPMSNQSRQQADGAMNQNGQ